MLVLTRRVGERVHVGKDVTVRVLAIRGAAVSLGFAAPASVPVVREEIIDAVGAQNRRASLARPEELVGVDAIFAGGSEG